MRFLTLSLSVAALATTAFASDPDYKIEKTVEVECDRKTKKGDKIDVHYRGTLQKDGSEFDASYNRGQPLSFQVGKGSVIKGWDDGLLDMCIGEKRLLTIPPSLGYGERAMGPIPAGSTLIFETELVGIQGVPKPETIKTITKSASSVASEAAEAVETAAEGIAEKVLDAAYTMLADTDGDGQEHNEL